MSYNSKYKSSEIEAILDSVEGKYVKPSTGIPASDLAPDVFLQGEKGEKGDKGDTGATGPQGPQGVGVTSVVQTTTSSADGGSNVMTVTLSNGTKSTFTIKNGSKGSQGEQGPKGDKGDKGDTGAAGTNGTNGTNGATFTPSVDSAGNLSWTNNGGLTNPPTVNIKGPKGDSGEGGGSSSGSGAWKSERIPRDTRYLKLSPFTLYYGGTIFGSLSIEFDTESYDYADYRALMYLSTSTSLTFEGNVCWPNGSHPNFEVGFYELNVTYDSYEDLFYAVLTRFE